ncbi:hypothetical protein GCM10022243_42320 [Saccharothrix violaceirubra]|uniref:Putative membrane protein n=1 Tax=Saccharothrix violaceirubra TaxID=413306 RepID=A0A7W7WVX1_9PSEU|nr:hypothetical protein [Saccharothrix violaceirubra]MBB4965521.1 putative membrane protein [Saccharothrix violaceirubra]
MHQYWRPGWPRHRIVWAVVVVAVAVGVLLPWDRGAITAFVLRSEWRGLLVFSASCGLGWVVHRLSAEREFTALAAAPLVFFSLFFGPAWWSVVGWALVLWLSIVVPKEHRTDEIIVPDHGTIRPTTAELFAYLEKKRERG